MKTNLIRRSFSILAIMLFAVLSLMSARATELIVNGNFETGSTGTGWTLVGASGNVISTFANLYHSPTHYLWFGDDNGTDTAYQDITIPANASVVTLSFYYNINTSQTSGTPDTFRATIRNTSNSTLATVANWSNLNGTTAGSYSQMTYNLLPYAGSTVRIYFTSTCTLVGSKTTNFRIDDVSVQVTAPTVSAPTVSTSPADQITTTSARMNGTVNPNGADTTVYFQYGLTTAYGNNTGTADFGSGTTTLSGSSSLSGLTPNTTYHYQFVAQNSAGTRYGGDVPFTTLNSCSYSLSSYSAGPSSSSGSSSFTVTTGSGCTWSASSDATSWLHTSSGTTGSGTVNYSYDANASTSPRTGHITVQDQTFTVTQIGLTYSTRQGVDYSFTRPSPSGLKAAGYDFAIRYTGGSASKDITASEAQTLQAAGLDIIIVFEGTATRMQSGYNAGVSDANTAVTQATTAGAPQNFFCYFACDFDAQPSDQTTINAYLDGAASILGVQRVGFYGGYYPLKSVLDAGKAAKGWQTTAWSGGLKDSRISLFQNAYNLALPGDPSNEFDGDEGYGNDLGQWSVSPPPTVSIGSVSPNPSSVVAGNTFTINAAVNSSQSQSVLLGASLVPAGTTSGYISDPPHDASWTLNSGNNNVFRQFTVSAGTAAGTYDLLFAVWKDSNGDGQIDAGDTLLAGPTTVANAVTITTPCTYSLSFYSASPGYGSGSSSFNVIAGSGCSWSAVSDATSWLHTSSSGSGNGTVNYSYDANASTSSRIGHITAGGQSFTVTQDGAPCSYSLSSYSASPGYGSGSSSFNVIAGSGCSWTATANQTWIHTSSSGSGNGTVNYTIDANASTSSRTDTITLQGQTFTITQAGAPCTYSLSSYSASPGSGSGSGSFNVIAGSGCSWTATANQTWIHTTSSGSGNGTVNYTIDANTSASSRIGTITVAGQTFTITQAGASLLMISNPKLTGTTFTLSVPTQVGFNYTLEYKNALSDANWMAGQMISGTGGTITLTDTGATGSRRLYHVRVQ